MPLSTGTGRLPVRSNLTTLSPSGLLPWKIKASQSIVVSNHLHGNLVLGYFLPDQHQSRSGFHRELNRSTRLSRTQSDEMGYFPDQHHNYYYHPSLQSDEMGYFPDQHHNCLGFSRRSMIKIRRSMYLFSI